MDKMRPWWGDSSWDVLWQFAYRQATLGEPEFSRQEPAWDRVRGAAARISVWLPVLWRARVAGLPKDWRFELPTGDAGGVAIAAAAIELADQPVQLRAALTLIEDEPATTDHLLAMKTLAALATTDRDDLQYLIDHLNITSRQEVWAIVARYFPNAPIPQRSTHLIQDLLEPE